MKTKALCCSKLTLALYCRAIEVLVIERGEHYSIVKYRSTNVIVETKDLKFCKEAS